MDKVEEVFTRGVTNVIPNKKQLEESLRSGKKLNVYLGIDPTAVKIHLGHAVLLRKLQALSELNHNVTFLIGDFTALIGDTSDKESERPILTKEEIRENFKTYKKQAEKLTDFSKIKIKYNSEWLKKLTFEKIVKLAQHFSVGDFVGRELIKKRLSEGKRVRLDETLYPVMQGYDSYFMDTDIQVGGADQTFNMQAGRSLQKKIRGKESFVLVTGYLEGTDGRKMSKSWGNAIWLEDTPNEIFGKVMSINDNLINQYFELATNLPLSRVETENNTLKDGENPLTVKRRLAYQIVKELHGDVQAQHAQDYFDKTFRKAKPEYKKEVPFRPILSSLVANSSGASISEAKRLILQGAVDVNEKTVTDPKHKMKGGERIKVGKKTFVKVSTKGRSASG